MFTFTGTLKDHSGNAIKGDEITFLPTPDRTLAEQKNTVYYKPVKTKTSAGGKFAVDLVTYPGLVYTITNSTLGRITFDPPEDDTTMDLADVAPVPAPSRMADYLRGIGVESITDTDGDGVATVLFTDGSTSPLPLPEGARGPRGPAGPQGVGITDVTDTDGDGTATVHFSDGSLEQLPLPEGPRGPQGPQGPQGERGPRGVQGPQGLQGPQGADGPRGVSVESVTDTDGDGTATVALSDGSASSLPLPDGPRGPQGVSGVQTDTFHVTAEFNNDSWVSVSYSAPNVTNQDYSTAKVDLSTSQYAIAGLTSSTVYVTRIDGASVTETVPVKITVFKFNDSGDDPNPFELRGTGPPDSVIAQPGTYYTDEAGTNGAWRWLKESGSGTSGWKVIYGDTGWRTIGADLVNGWTGPVSAVGPKIRRINNIVYWNLRNLDGTDNTSSTFLELSEEGFFPDSADGGLFPFGATVAMLSVFSNGVSRIYSLGGQLGSGSPATTFYTTNRPWPTTLPGTAV